jgi:hypothetical protein
MTPVLKEAMADEYTSRALFTSLHTGDPGDDGANELAVARVALVWSAGVDPGDRVSDSMEFDIPDDTDLTHVGIWDDETAGDFQDSRANSVSFPVAGTYVVVLTHSQS